MQNIGWKIKKVIPLRKLMLRWEDRINMDLKELGKAEYWYFDRTALLVLFIICSVRIFWVEMTLAII
jgi:hypothetical protein